MNKKITNNNTSDFFFASFFFAGFSFLYDFLSFRTEMVVLLRISSVIFWNMSSERRFWRIIDKMLKKGAKSDIVVKMGIFWCVYGLDEEISC